ncbi:hypothetical protein ACFXG4_27350 [Nocardia sp. NPDC059246]|uniref:hypothetical protein n=1 Tax=unclassified Nocardia TaxID=2637762 RepID=UPI00369C25BD
MSTPIVFLDTETTGLHAGRRPWEIGMIRRDGDEQREITLYVSDVELANAELIGLNIGGFHERHPLYRKEIGGAFDAEYESDDVVDPSEADALLKVDEALYPEQRAAVIVERWTRGAHIVGACPNFDTETLAAMLWRHDLCPAWHYHLLDVEVMAMGWLAALGETVDLPCKSDDLSRMCGVEPPSKSERHTAMGDARWVRRWYDRITSAAVGGAE